MLQSALYMHDSSTMTGVTSRTLRPPTQPTPLERARRDVVARWIPVDPALLAKISEGFKTGRYDLGFDFLFEDIKSDPSLLLFALNKASSRKGRVWKDPVEALRNLSENDQRALFSTDSTSISTHSLESIEQVQSQTLKESLLGAVVTEVCADNTGLNSQLAYATSLVRQLGHLLISWNHPQLYKQAKARQRKGEDFDQVISDELGYSVEMLLASLIQSWNIDPSFKVACGLATPEKDIGAVKPSSIVAEELAELCRSGEILARVNNPEQYPHAEREWKESQEFLKELLGDEGLFRITERFNQICAHYANILPTEFAPSPRIDPESKIQSWKSNQRLATNPYAKHCPPVIRRKITEIYEELGRNESRETLMRTVVHEIIPQLGFRSGCMYTHDPHIRALVPRLIFGEYPPELRRKISLTGISDEYDPIRVAYSCTQPFVEITPTGTKTSDGSVTGTLGAQKKIGILHLEFQTNEGDDISSHYLVLFKAVRQTIHDLLGLQ